MDSSSNPNDLKPHRKLFAWQEAMALARMVYRMTEKMPKSELYGLTSQLRRAAVSIPSQIAEGNGRRKPGDKAHFLAIARGSLNELDTQLELAHEFGYFSRDEHRAMTEQASKVSRLLNGLLAKHSKG